MNTNTTATATTQSLLEAAREAFGLLRRNDNPRTQVVLDLLGATTDEDRDDVVATYGAGFTRRALRIAALSWSKDEEVANLFWTLRDSVTAEGWVDFDSEDSEDNVLVAA
jgi:hypothetical protein